jgi:hypothetical protein
MNHSVRYTTRLLFLAVLGFGCPAWWSTDTDSDSTYRAAVLDLTMGNRRIDLIGEGAEVSVTLHPVDHRHGTAQVSVLIPTRFAAPGENGGRLLSGTYAVDSEGGIAIDHEGDSFVPYMRWHRVGDSLRAEVRTLDGSLDAILVRRE